MKLPSRCSSYRPSDSDAALLLAILGPRRMKRLQEALGGRRVWVPKACVRPTCLACARRDECVRAWRRKGRDVKEIAAYLGLSPKTVYRVAR